jgi:hypothetical protein
MTIKKICGYAVGPVLLAAMLVYGAMSWVSLPVVYFEQLTDRCVAVWSEEGITDCSQIPKKYHSKVVPPGTTLQDAKRFLRV